MTWIRAGAGWMERRRRIWGLEGATGASEGHGCRSERHRSQGWGWGFTAAGGASFTTMTGKRKAFQGTWGPILDMGPLWISCLDAQEQTGAPGEILAPAVDSEFSTETPSHQGEAHVFPSDHLPCAHLAQSQPRKWAQSQPSSTGTHATLIPLTGVEHEVQSPAVPPGCLHLLTELLTLLFAISCPSEKMSTTYTF